MEFTPEQIQVMLGLAGAPVITALTNLIKTTFPDLESRWHPLVAISWGLFINMVWGTVTLVAKPTVESPLMIITVAAMLGLLSGLAASGLYSGTRALRGE